MTAIKINLRGNFVTQYSNYAFNSMCVFKGQMLGASASGIFQLETGKRDIYTPGTDERRIAAWFELPTSNLGQDFIKKIRRMYARGEFDGDWQITCIAKGSAETQKTYQITPRNTDNLQHTIQIKTNHKQKAEDFAFLVENMDGADGSFDAIDAVVILVTRRKGL